jgi:Tfp pilus assembly protein PilN
MDFLNQLLSRMAQKPKKGSAVGIYISPFSSLEIVEYDLAFDDIKQYNKIPFEYDSILREVNIENFESTLQSLLRSFSFPSQTPVVLSLPNILINKKILPSELEAEEVATALTSETEKNYIFKKSEPKVSWSVVSSDRENQSNTLVFSALQKVMVEKLEDVFKRQGLKLVSIESSYSSFIRGLSVSGLVHDYIDNNLSWHVLIVKNNINAVISLKGSQVINITENPLALKSLELEDLYPTISESIKEKIQDLPVESLVVVNYSSIIDSQKLIRNLGYSCPFLEIDDNNFEGEALFESYVASELTSVSPETIGAACYKSAPVPFSFNFIEFGETEVEVPDFLASLGVMGNPVHLILLALIAVSLVFTLLVALIAIPVNAGLEERYRKLYLECKKYEETSQPQQKEFNIYNVVEKGFTNNEKLITSYDAISAVIPEKVWISSVNIDDDLKTTITGRAYNVEDIVTYYQNLLNVAKFDNLKIKSIKVAGGVQNKSEQTSDVQINSINSTNGQNNNSSPATPADNNRGSMLPLPPLPSSPNSNPLLADAGEKYYEFNFSNYADDKKTEEKDQTQNAPAPVGNSNTN